MEISSTTECSCNKHDNIERVSVKLNFPDYLGMARVRLGIGRNNYRVKPGIYAVGIPNKDSPVFISANYKLSFDTLRKELKTIDSWILVLDTNGINVWCAAGKGTFGTDELVNRIKQTGLKNIVKHKKIIVPQLGAPGISAHMVKKQCGFKVIYGPVRAKDIPAFLAAGCKATEKMRQVTFNWKERLVLIPLELMGVIKYGLIVFIIFFFISWITLGTGNISDILGAAFYNFFPYAVVLITGTVLAPLFLPLIPGRAFAWKGWLLGLVWAGIYFFLIFPGENWLYILSGFLILPVISSFLFMNFTGSSTYTSLSGVIKEMRIAVPIQIILAMLGIIAIISNLVIKSV